MKGLENYFDTDASLELEDNQKIFKYLVDNSAENFLNYKRSKKINNSINTNEMPIAVTDTRYFMQKHKDIRKDLITQKKVRSLANCMACYITANKGLYSQRDIEIPNYGRWDD